MTSAPPADSCWNLSAPVESAASQHTHTHTHTHLRAFTPQSSISQPDEVVEVAYIRKALITGVHSNGNTTRAHAVLGAKCFENVLKTAWSPARRQPIRTHARQDTFSHVFFPYQDRGGQLMCCDNIYYCGTRKSHRSLLGAIHLLPFINVFLRE